MRPKKEITKPEKNTTAAQVQWGAPDEVGNGAGLAAAGSPPGHAGQPGQAGMAGMCGQVGQAGHLGTDRHLEM